MLLVLYIFCRTFFLFSLKKTYFLFLFFIRCSQQKQILLCLYSLTYSSYVVRNIKSAFVVFSPTHIRRGSKSKGGNVLNIHTSHSCLQYKNDIDLFHFFTSIRCCSHREDVLCVYLFQPILGCYSQLLVLEANTQKVKKKANFNSTTQNTRTLSGQTPFSKQRTDR